VILGPTASGKTSLAVKLASEIDGEIISADSRQVYRGMDLGTGKDLSEYIVEGRFIPHHMIDIINPEEEFNLFEFQQRFVQYFKAIRERNKFPVLVGGTGLYLESVILHYQLTKVPENPALRERLAHLDMAALAEIYLSQTGAIAHNRSDLMDRNRLLRAIEIASHSVDDLDCVEQTALLSISPLVFGIRWNRAELRPRIRKRLKDRIDAGLIEEVERLKARGLSWERLDAFGLEYRYVALYLRCQLSFDDMFKVLETKIHQFAKRQETWFRRMERRGIDIHWVNGNDYGEIRRYIQGTPLQ